MTLCVYLCEYVMSWLCCLYLNRGGSVRVDRSYKLIHDLNVSSWNVQHHRSWPFSGLRRVFFFSHETTLWKRNRPGLRDLEKAMVVNQGHSFKSTTRDIGFWLVWSLTDFQLILYGRHTILMGYKTLVNENNVSIFNLKKNILALLNRCGVFCGNKKTSDIKWQENNRLPGCKTNSASCPVTPVTDYYPMTTHPVVY